MASAFFETMGINYVLPVAECDLNITSKQQYGIISGIWFAGEKIIELIKLEQCVTEKVMTKA